MFLLKDKGCKLENGKPRLCMTWKYFWRTQRRWKRRDRKIRAANTHQRHAKHQTMRKMKGNFSHSHPGLNMYTLRTAYQNTRGQKRQKTTAVLVGGSKVLSSERNRTSKHCTSGASSGPSRGANNKKIHILDSLQWPQFQVWNGLMPSVFLSTVWFGKGK